MTENISTLTPNATEEGIGILDVVNNNLTQGIWAQLPSARNFSDVKKSCHVLKNNGTLALLFPGWEGIPTNICLNITLFAILMIGFSLLIRKIYKTEKRINAEYIATERSSDWIHFIYGKRSISHNIMYTTKEINREHPNAYLPLILHEHHNLIKGMLKPESTDKQQPELFLRGIDSEIEAKNNEKIVVSEGNASLTPNATKSSKEEEEEEDDPEEKEKTDQLKTILFDEDLNQKLSVVTDEVIGKEPSKGCVQTFWFWLNKYFLIKDEDIGRKRGSDAVQYLKFQRYIIYFLVFITLISLFVILPVNLSGDRLADRDNSQFLKTTILNIESDSSIVYIHGLMTVLIVVMGVFLMKTFSELVGKRVENVDKRILLIENIPKLKRNSMEIRTYFSNNFPKVVIKRITFVYDIRRLAALMKKLWTSIEAKKYCRLYQRKYGKKCEVRPYCLGHFRGICCCCKCKPKVNGLEYYTREQKSLENDIDMEVMITTATPQRIAILVFENEGMAAEVLSSFRRKHCYCYTISRIFRRLICCKKSDPLKSDQWYVSYAPLPDDIDWKNIATKKWKVWTLNITMNIVIVILFIFLTTPTSALNLLRLFKRAKKGDEQDKWKEEDKEEEEDKLNKQIVEVFLSYGPTLGYTILAGVLPQMIRILTANIPFRTKSDYNHSLMYKSYLFLILMVLILPSLETITVFTLMESYFKVNGTGTAIELDWSCLFPAENGAFFLNYVFTTTFVGNAIQIIRVSELLLYTLRFCLFSRNGAEYLTARQNTKFDFNFGTYYPKMLLIFTLIVTFSISCPLIAPVGLFYMIVKNLVDRYLIYHVFVPTKISQRIHSKAILFVYIALLFLLMQVYTHLAAMEDNIPSIIVGIVLIIHFLLTIFEFFLDFISF